MLRGVYDHAISSSSYLLPSLALLLEVTAKISDYSLECNLGYSVVAIRRVNSAYQRGKIGSLGIECRPLAPAIKSKEVKCSKLSTIPRCQGQLEGCSADQWLGGFHAYALGNEMDTVILDPVCCESPQVKIQEATCAGELINTAREPFDHSIAADDANNNLVYRGVQCWQKYTSMHQRAADVGAFNSTPTVIDFAWEMEVCQYTARPSQHNIHEGGGLFGVKSTTNTTAVAFLPQVDPHSPDGQRTTDRANEDSPKCPLCKCPHCGISLCRDGTEPIRLTHVVLRKEVEGNARKKGEVDDDSENRYRCTCDCLCKFQCPGESV